VDLEALEFKMNSEVEEWKDIAGYEKFYQVSNLGRVKSLDRIVNGFGLKCTQRIKGKVLKLQKRKTGHLDILLKKNGIEERCWVHRLVARAFLENKQNLPIVNHIDSNPENNNVNNLEWCTQEHNIRHCVKSGRFNARKGIEHKDCKLSESDVLKIRELAANGYTYRKLSKLFPVSEGHIKNVVIRKKWKHI
jgi:hypothetical protein